MKVYGKITIEDYHRPDGKERKRIRFRFDDDLKKWHSRILQHTPNENGWVIQRGGRFVDATYLHDIARVEKILPNYLVEIEEYERKQQAALREAANNPPQTRKVEVELPITMLDALVDYGAENNMRLHEAIKHILKEKLDGKA